MECSAKAAITVVHQVTRWIARYPAGFDYRLRQPLRIGMGSDPRMYEFTSAIVNEKKHVQCLKPDSLKRVSYRIIGGIVTPTKFWHPTGIAVYRH